MTINVLLYFYMIGNGSEVHTECREDFIYGTVCSARIKAKITELFSNATWWIIFEKS
jgi:hypothetical protein